MRKISLHLVFATLAVAQPNSILSISSRGPEPGSLVMGGSGALKSGISIRYKSMLSGASSATGASGLGQGGISMTGDTIHRVMANRLTGTYFGYDLTVVVSGSSGDYLASFQPLTNADVLLQHVTNGSALSLMPPPKYPAPQVVHDGDIIALDLMTSPDGKQKLTDYIQILAHPAQPPTPAVTAEARDYSVDDGPISFDQGDIMMISSNGQPNRLQTTFDGRPGATFWISFPGQGRYIASLTPHPGFTQSGGIRDNSVSIEDGQNTFTVRFFNPVAGAGKAWNLYVLHDPAYVPRRGMEDRVLMGTDRIENLLPKQ
jgi:hypothetical protein